MSKGIPATVGVPFCICIRQEVWLLATERIA